MAIWPVINWHIFNFSLYRWLSNNLTKYFIFIMPSVRVKLEKFKRGKYPSTRENILHGFWWIPWRIFRVEYWNELPWTISSFSTADRRIIYLDIVHGVFPWIPWNVSMDCGFGPCFPWTVSTDKMSSLVHGVHGKLSVWSIETLFHGKFPCFPLQASFPFMDNVHG